MFHVLWSKDNMLAPKYQRPVTDPTKVKNSYSFPLFFHHLWYSQQLQLLKNVHFTHRKLSFDIHSC